MFLTLSLIKSTIWDLDVKSQDAMANLFSLKVWSVSRRIQVCDAYELWSP